MTTWEIILTVAGITVYLVLLVALLARVVWGLRRIKNWLQVLTGTMLAVFLVTTFVFWPRPYSPATYLIRDHGVYASPLQFWEGCVRLVILWAVIGIVYAVLRLMLKDRNK